MDTQVIKSGMKVRRKNGEPWGGFDEVTADVRVNNWGDQIYAKETHTWLPPESVEIVPEKTIETEVEDQAILAIASASDDIVNRPSHYAKWKIEPITFVMENDLPFWKGNIIKYAVRAGSKLYDGMDAVQSEITDLEKVRRYAEMRVNQLKGEGVL
jgi:hypothetical protein